MVTMMMINDRRYPEVVSLAWQEKEMIDLVEAFIFIPLFFFLFVLS